MRVRRILPFVVLVVLIGVLFVAVFPTRTWLAQQREMAAATEQLEVLAHENERLARRVDALQSDGEIEKLAREQYNLVRPGEEAYALLPSSGDGSATGTGDDGALAAGTSEDGERKRNVVQKVWRFFTGWL